MKLFQFKKFRFLFVALVLSAGLVACDKDNFDETPSDPTYATTAQANGSQENPPVTTSGTATLIGEYNGRTNNWEYRINWTNMSSIVSAVQIHGPAQAGIAGQMQVALAITTPGITGKAEGNVTLTEEQQGYLLANQLYLSIITPSHVNGEVRGQIMTSQVH